MSNFPRIFDESRRSPAFKFQNLDRVCIAIVAIVGVTIATVCYMATHERRPGMTLTQQLALTKYELELEQERSETLLILLKQALGDASEEP